MDKIRFDRVEEPYGEFSNLSPHTIFLDGTTWRTCEHYYQGQKYIEAEYRVFVLMTDSPMDVMKRGRDKSLPLRTDWDQVRDQIMRKVISAKIAQYSEVRELLLSTGQAEILFHTSEDYYWGDGGDGSGSNMLGRIFMDIRQELTKDGPYNELASPLPPPWLKYPTRPRNSIGWRMGAGDDYLCEWAPWYDGLSPSGKLKYQEMYPEPAGWRGYYKPYKPKKRKPRPTKAR